MKKIIQLLGTLVIGVFYCNTIFASCTPATDPGSISGANSVCTGIATSYSISNGPGNVWSVSGSGVTASYNPTAPTKTSAITFSGSGITTLTVKNTDCQNCDKCSASEKEKSSTLQITVNPRPDNPAITGPSTACQGEQLSFNASTSGGTSPYTFTWSAAPSGWSGGGGTGASKGYTAGTGNGTISVTVKDDKNCQGAAAGSKSVTVTPTPTPPSLQSITNP